MLAGNDDDLVVEKLNKNLCHQFQSHPKSLYNNYNNLAPIQFDYWTMRLISCNERQKKKHHTISILDHLNVIKAIKCIYMFVFYNRNFNHFDELALNKEIRTKRQTPQSLNHNNSSCKKQRCFVYNTWDDTYETLHWMGQWGGAYNSKSFVTWILNLTIYRLKIA